MSTANIGERRSDGAVITASNVNDDSMEAVVVCAKALVPYAEEWLLTLIRSHKESAAPGGDLVISDPDVADEIRVLAAFLSAMETAK